MEYPIFQGKNDSPGVIWTFMMYYDCIIAEEKKNFGH